MQMRRTWDGGVGDMVGAYEVHIWRMWGACRQRRGRTRANPGVRAQFAGGQYAGGQEEQGEERAYQEGRCGRKGRPRTVASGKGEQRRQTQQEDHPTAVAACGGTGQMRHGTRRYGTVRYDTVRYGTVQWDTMHAASIQDETRLRLIRR